jgi:hypothetical protein
MISLKIYMKYPAAPFVLLSSTKTYPSWPADTASI